MLLDRLKTPQVVQLAAIRILDAINANLEIDGHLLSVSAQAGAVVCPDLASDMESILNAADGAMKHARDHDLNYSLYETSIRSKDKQIANIRGNLRVALDNSDLMLYYQPQVNLQQGTLSGCEALARWNHAEHGWIRPDLFIPVAEKSELIDTLTYWTVNVALREWFQFCGSCASGAVAINLSAKMLQSPEVVELVRRALNIWGAEPGSLVLEVTESAMMSDPKTALHTLSALHEMGITLAIDDFGTGYSSLAYLRDLPVAELKIDKSFVQHMAEDTQDRKIVQSIIDLAHNLEMSVVAEGIENQQSLDMLIGMGCDHGQGYYIARPMPISELPPWVDGSNWSRPRKIASE